MVCNYSFINRLLVNVEDCEVKMIDAYYGFTIWLFIWYTAKLLNKKNILIDGYWHIPQTFFLIAVYCLPIVWVQSTLIIYTTIHWGFMFPFLFNSGLNIYRKLPIRHLGKYDFLKFWHTVILFSVGIILLILKYF